VRQQLAALAVLFLAAHLFLLPPTLEDIDSINFALGVRDFDVARHQPHPPGYPVFIALAKASTGIADALGVPASGPRGLSILSALSAALLVPLLAGLYRRLTDDAAVAWWAMALTVCSPLFWFTALRPLSDMTGLAVAVATQLLLAGVLRGTLPVGAERPGPPLQVLLILGAALCGLAAGVRAQTVMLTGPLLAAALVWPNAGLTIVHRLAALGAAAAGALAWAFPLVAATGGLEEYFAALGTQAGEDFSGVVMLWTTRTARAAADAVAYSFVWPWGAPWLGRTMVAVAAIGVLRMAWRAPRALVVLAIAFVPYAVFHLLFHETVTVRYALPLVLPVACLAAFAAAGLGRAGLTAAGSVTVVLMLVMALPPARAFGRDGSPAFRAFRDITRSDGPGTPGAPVVGMHAVMRRVEEWERPFHQARVLRAPHGREWLALVEHWRAEPDSVVRFVADPRRTDLALFDPHSRTLERSEAWTFPQMPYVGGTRPGAADLYTMRPPGWMLDRGWSLTAEVGGITAREGLGPHAQPTVAWARARPGPAALLIGGRNLEAEGQPSVRLTLEGPDGVLEAWDASPGFFFRQIALPAGALAGSGYLPLRLTAAAAGPPGGGPPARIRSPRVSLEQFDLQSPDRAMVGFVDGWQEPEYSPATSRSWRWMSERATLWVSPAGRPVTLVVSGESPRRYFDRAPTVRVVVAGREAGRFSPSADFEQAVTLPANHLEASRGEVVLESDLWFSPADRGESADRRHLALRIYAVAVR
jgi:hypothetical protein